MLDSDLAGLYGTEVKKLIQQVKRNSERFPSDFMFQQTEEEQANFRSQNVTENVSIMSRSKPYVFTEQDIYVCGASSKDAGQKICTITRLLDRGSMNFTIDA